MVHVLVLAVVPSTRRRRPRRQQQIPSRCYYIYNSSNYYCWWMLATLLIGITRSVSSFPLRTFASDHRPVSTLNRISIVVQQQQLLLLQRGGVSSSSSTGSISSDTNPNSIASTPRLFHQSQRAVGPSYRTSRSSTMMSAQTSEPVVTATATATAISSNNPNEATEKLISLRSLMKERNIDIYLIPSDDPHLSEYVPTAYMRRAYISGFRGSAGTAVITQQDAYVWTDSRYWNEASLQLDDTFWTLQRGGSPDVLTIPKWLGSTAKEYYTKHQRPMTIGIDPYVHPASFAKEVDDIMMDIAKTENYSENPAILQTLTDNENLVDLLWEKDINALRPSIPISPFRVHPIEYAGVSVLEKIRLIRRDMIAKKATALVLCTLDDVAYTLNVRAQGDIDTCPVGIAYCMITTTNIYLYCDPNKIVNISDYINDNQIAIRPYDQIVADVQQHCMEDDTNKVWIDKSRANYALVSAVPGKQCIDCQNPITIMKACKNEAELNGMREAHIVDGVAMAKFMAWLEHEIITNQRSISEVEIDIVLTKYRSEQNGFLECSFPTIAGVGPNGAIIHYRAKEGDELMRYLNRTAPILIDSGGQYIYGTTDVTRTWSFQQQPDPRFIDYYTRVLKGNIGLDTMIFPENTPGLVLDVYARKHLWDIGSDYGHGTGHGVGAALNVHEGPQSISPRYSNTEGLKIGMVVSNEPGYYEDNNFGIRIENLLEIQPVESIQMNGEQTLPPHLTTKSTATKKKFLKFTKLTMIPIQKNLIDISIMTNIELDWLDQYHAHILEVVGSRLQENTPESLWLQRACSKIDRSL